MTPDSEAPAEMHFYFPGFRALCMAENATHTLHNLLTLRGALVRDARSWAGYLTDAIDRYAQRSDVVFASHHWPTWGTEKLTDYLAVQRDLYAYLHDETLRHINLGFQGTEISELIQLPPALENAWSTRGYYGSVSHNVKAIYQRYMGWFDANPVNLWAHTPEDQAARYTKALGGVARVRELARDAENEGDLRWAATLLGHAVFSDDTDATSKTQLANVLEKLGFGSENATWRNFFLGGAKELREGAFGTPTRANATGLSRYVTVSQILDALAIAIEGPRAWDLDLAFDLHITDTGETHRITLKNGVLIHRPAPGELAPLSTFASCTKQRFMQLLQGDLTAPGLAIDGDGHVLAGILRVASVGDPGFAIVTP